MDQLIDGRLDQRATSSDSKHRGDATTLALVEAAISFATRSMVSCFARR
jgi:hypothetical protein